MTTKPDDISTEVMDIAASIERDIPARIGGANRVFIRAVIARAIMSAEKRGEEREREACAVVADGDLGDRSTKNRIANAIRSRNV